MAYLYQVETMLKAVKYKNVTFEQDIWLVDNMRLIKKRYSV
jgi:hypothetical protein